MVLKLEEGKFYRTRDGKTLGPYVHNTSDVWWVDGHYGSSRFEDGRLNKRCESPGDLVSEIGPVRTVTRKEIVPGQYGVVEVSSDSTITDEGVSLWLPRNHRYSPAKLRETIATLIEIADALESPSHE